MTYSTMQVLSVLNSFDLPSCGKDKLFYSSLVKIRIEYLSLNLSKLTWILSLTELQNPQ